MPSLPPWNSSQRSSIWALIRPTTSPSRSARKYSASAWSKNGFLSRSRNWRRSKSSGGTHCGSSRCRRNGSLMKRSGRARPATGRIRTSATPGNVAVGGAWDTSGHERDDSGAGRRVREGAHPRPQRAARGRASEADLLPYFRILIESEAGPVVEMEGRETIMLGSNNYLGLTGDPGSSRPPATRSRPTAPALTGSRLLNGTIPLHVELEREIAEWMGPRTRSSSPPATRRTSAAIGTILGPGRHGDLRLRPTTPRSSTAASSRAPGCAPSATTRWTSSSGCSSAPPATGAACWWSSTASSRWRATSATCRRSSSSASATAPG